MSQSTRLAECSRGCRGTVQIGLTYFEYNESSQPLHSRMWPGWPPPESLPTRGTCHQRNAFAELAVFLPRTVIEALRVAELDAAQVSTPSRSQSL